GSALAVFVDSNNVMGNLPSSRRFKHDIKPIDKASEALYALKPISFKYNSDQKGTTQYGLVAEDVAEVNPNLVAYKDSKIWAVHYEQINVMLLNEFLKEHKQLQEQGATIARLQKQIETLTAGLQKVSAQV